MIPLDELPVSDATRERLREWAARWEHLAAGGVTTDAPLPDEAARTLLKADAQRLRERLQDELGADWDVVLAT